MPGALPSLTVFELILCIRLLLYALTTATWREYYFSTHVTDEEMESERW